jgi:hypothetical protein
MRSTPARIGLLAALVAGAVVLFIVLSGGDDDGSESGAGTTAAEQTTATATTPTAAAPESTVIEVRNGRPVGGVQRIEASRGERVVVEVQLSPPEEEIHVHGYELTRPAAKSPVRFSFPANLEGVFEIEVHRHDGSDVQIAELRVTP